MTAAPIWPNVSAEQYEADRGRVPFPVHNCTGWLPDGRRIEAQDWPSADHAKAALEMARPHFTADRLQSLAPDAMEWFCDSIADVIVASLKIAVDRPYGMAIIVDAPATKL